MINLFMQDDLASRDLRQSFLAAGMDHPTVLLDYHGFASPDILDPFSYFMGQEDPNGRALFFNELKVPAYWEISGDASSAKLTHYHQEKARIYYAQPHEKRLINKVDWLDDQGRVRFVDCYNQYGRRYARISMNKLSQLAVTTYYDVNGCEVLVHNHITQDYILTYQGQTHIFKDKIDFFLFYLQESGLDYSSIIYNSLSTSFFLTLRLEADGEDFLVWQEPIQDEIPGNMQFILSGGVPRTKRILVPNQHTYKKIQELSQQDDIQPFGYLYQYEKEAQPGQHCLILTNSDQIEGLDVLTERLPHCHFSIAAITEMSDRLKAFEGKGNVSLYPNASQTKLLDLYQQSNIYLDINHSNEIFQAVRRAFDHQLPIFAFEETAHERSYIAAKHIFPANKLEKLAQAIEHVMTSENAYQEALKDQQQAANQIDPKSFQQAFQLKEDKDV